MALTVVSLVLTVVGCAAYLGLWAAGQVESTFYLAGSALPMGGLVTLVALIGAMLLHELVHGLADAALRGATRLRRRSALGDPAYLYCTAPLHRFTRAHSSGSPSPRPCWSGRCWRR